jgi:outer membrane protein insertion porin family
VGETYNDDKGAAAIRALFGLGLFNDVRLEVSGDVLVVIVQERPTVAAVEFAGNKEFSNEVLQAVLRDAGLTGPALRPRAGDRAEQELKRQYINRSLYGAEVVTTVTPTERNQVRLTFNITEGRPARIKDIDIVGNQAFTDGQPEGSVRSRHRRLAVVVHQERPVFARQAQRRPGGAALVLPDARLPGLQDRLHAGGHLARQGRSISITVNITEGAALRGVQRVAGRQLPGQGGRVQVAGQPSAPARPTTPTRWPRPPRPSPSTSATSATPSPASRPCPRWTAPTTAWPSCIRSEPSRRAYVRRINIQGNTRTRDEVVRREFRQYESAWYDAEKIKLSRDRVDRLGYFTELSVDHRRGAGAPDQVDLNVEVKEKPTGSISVGAATRRPRSWPSPSALSQDNVFGSGNKLDLQLNTGKYNRTIVVSAVDPYFTTNGVSRTVDLYYRTQKPYQDQGGNYTLVTMGVGLKFGVPVTETDTVYLGMNAERTRIKPAPTSRPRTWTTPTASATPARPSR